MTLIGKVLLLLNFTFSIVGCTWALILYNNNVNYTDDPPKAPKDKPDAPDLPPGQLWEVSNQIKGLTAIKAREEARLKDGRIILAAKEDRVVDDRPWYLTQLEQQREGKGAIKSVVFTAANLPEPDPANYGRPKLVPAARPRLPGVEGGVDEPLLSLSFYEGELVTNMRELVSVREEFQRNLEEDMKLTNELLGMPPDVKGLRQQVVDERAKWRLIDDEWRLMQPLETINEVESELLIRRNGNLNERVKELDDYLLKKYRITMPRD